MRDIAQQENPAKDAEIPLQLARLGDAASQLNDLLCKLEERLDGILDKSPKESPDACAKATSDECNTLIGSMIKEIRYKVKSSESKIRSLLTDIEL